MSAPKGADITDAETRSALVLLFKHSRAPNRCINLVKGANYNISRGRIIDIVQKRQYIAQTSAKVMGARTPSLYHFELRCTVLRSVHSMSLAFLSAT